MLAAATATTAAPRLSVRRPSPTTAEFTVTTSPRPTLRLHALRLALLAARLVLSLAAALLLHARWAASPLAAPLRASPLPMPRDALLSLDALRYGLDAFARSPAAAALQSLALALPLPLLLPGAAAVFYVLGLRLHASESLLVLRGLGVQTSESPASYFASTATRFIPTEKIQDILINEAFLGFEVRYYLVVVVEAEEDVVVVFPGLLPKRDIVETVWRGVRECLYESGREDKNPAALAS